ncbi:MAG: hypothetical protein IIB08_04675 [Bacteroidetes bacterium]|nr:hypothetical protein [Bacteroidota bacterium]
MIKKFYKSAKYLHKSEKVGNQEIGSIMALFNLYLITKDENIKKIVDKKIKKLPQNKEGWFYEYNGADIGYQTLSTEFLARYYQKTKDPYVLKKIKKSLSFLKYFIMPDGSVFNFGQIK